MEIPVNRPTAPFARLGWAAFIALLFVSALAPAISPHLDQAPVSRKISIEVTEATRLAFDISPRGDEIVFDVLGQLWLLPVAGGRARPITDALRDCAEDQEPAFSPDGTRLVFTGHRPGGRGLWLVETSGRNLRRLTQGYDFAATWSPSGRQVAFARSNQIRLLDVDTGAERRLEIAGLGVGSFRDPAWSADGSELFFVHSSGAAPVPGAGRDSGGSLYRVAAAGGKATPVAPESTTALRPAASPEGLRLAFFTRQDGLVQLWVRDLHSGESRRIVEGDEILPLRVRWLGDSLLYSAAGQLWRCDVRGGEPRPVPFRARVKLERREVSIPPAAVAVPGAEREARGFSGLALAPDGERIAIIALGKLWLLEPQTAPRAVASLPIDANGLTWSPDGREVAWSAGPLNVEDLLVTEVSTGTTRRLTNWPGREFRPSWSPDGRHIAFIWAEKPVPSNNGYRLRVIPARPRQELRPEAALDLADVSRTWNFPYLWHGRQAPQWSPDSQSLLLFDRPSLPASNQARLIARSGEKRDVQRFPVASTGVRWSRTGALVYVEDNRLWSVELGPDGTIAGEPRLLSADPALFPDVSADGSVLYVSGDGLRIRRPDGRVVRVGWPLKYRVPDAPSPLLIQNARVIAGAGQLPAARDVLIRGGRIERIAPPGAIPPPSGAQVIPAGDLTLMPGLSDAHNHVTEPAQLRGLLYHGVTTLRDMGAPMTLAAAFRDAIEAGLQPGPRILLGGFQFHSGHVAEFSTTGDVFQSSPVGEGIARGVTLARAFGAVHVKMYVPITTEAGVHTIRAARELGAHVSSHTAMPLPFVAAGIEGKEHLGPSGERADDVVYDDIVQLFRAAGLWVVPTVSAWAAGTDPALLDAPDTAPFLTPFLRWFALPLAGRPEARKAAAQAALRSIPKLHRAGVPIAAGTDLRRLPWGMHAELEQLVRAGLSPLEAIRSATAVAARISGVAPSVGTVEEGKIADLLLLEADPLADIRNTRRIRLVIQGGRIVDREALLRGRQ